MSPGDESGQRGSAAYPEVRLPYGRQWIEEDDVRAVAKALRSRFITTGPMVEAFERAVVEFVGAESGVAVSSGTAALHTAMHAAQIRPGDEVIVPALTFVATANAVVFQGGTPVFGDVDPDTLLIDVAKIEARITDKTKAIVSVDYAGQPCDYDALRVIADNHGLLLIADASHALGAGYRGRQVGTLADLTVFSFHPVKHITTGEGGMVVMDNPEFARRGRSFRNHGISADHRERAEEGTWYYEMVNLGYNYRLTDFQCALGLSQLQKLPRWIARRRGVAEQYDRALEKLPGVRPLKVSPNVFHAYHLYVIRLDLDKVGRTREAIFSSLRDQGIGVNVHYVPVHLHPFYRDRFGLEPGLCPVAEDAYESIISLPVFPAMNDGDVTDVVGALERSVG